MDFKDSLRDIKSQMLAGSGAKNLGGNGETAAHSTAERRTESGKRNLTDNSKTGVNSKTRAAVSKDLPNSNEKAQSTANLNSNSNDAEKAYYANLERKKEALQSEVKEFLGL